MRMFGTSARRSALLALLPVAGFPCGAVSSPAVAQAANETVPLARGGAVLNGDGKQTGIRNADRHIPAAVKAARRARKDVRTTALWAFDESVGLYPSHPLDDSSPNDLVMALGQAATIKSGKFGNALFLTPQPRFTVPKGTAEQASFGLVELPPAPGRTVPPLTWFNAQFATLITDGEDHLRKEVGFTNPTDTDLNLGDYDWTVEFWYTRAGQPLSEDGVVFEIGTGPRGENDKITQLRLAADGSRFVLVNQPTGLNLDIPTDRAATSDGWHHYAFVYHAATDQLVHFVDGKAQRLPNAAPIEELPRGDEAYFTIGKNARWQSGLKGALDEVRFSAGARYQGDFTPPASLVEPRPVIKRAQGPHPLFADVKPGAPLDFGARKYLFIDGKILEGLGDAKLVVNPPRRAERVMGDIKGPFRKHLTVEEDDDGVIRIYNSVEDDYLAVYTSKDGIHFTAPDVGNGVYSGRRNIVIPDAVGGMGNPFIDREAPPQERWKYFSGTDRRGIYLWTSPDGYHWKRERTASVPFRAGSQTATFYDDQRQTFVSYHRSDALRLRSSVLTQQKDLGVPIHYTPLTQQDYFKLAKRYKMDGLMPWFLDNGPLTPGGFGLELPHAFDPEPMDPIGVDFYLTKATKYRWAPDTYLAFPVAYFQYDVGPPARQALGSKEEGRGSGPLETQISVSRNGLDWTRSPRPAYVGIGLHEGRDVKTAYIAHGMVRRGDEIWQYYFGETQYHSAIKRTEDERGVYRLVQRLDGFVSLDSPYDHEIEVTTKPLVFDGDRLKLNIDTDATGYAQVGFVDASGRPIPGFGVDDCIYINGDFISEDVKWLNKGVDVSALAGKEVRLVFRLRGSKLYSMEFARSADASAGN
ncbi:concanavalin A-like lectin/glucanase superfamily protein [Hephaestia caeni]|uniref:Concanavalin A-like lectin/glucanase superfamily protein n=1 Tax=Hephaestia caeni TaxID=645617 RepID=A0A397P8Z7_9SPHN|nr:LamG domain-containing protein [Hephaestia caeni]RIA45532.1 concanavalin A-like lectin/glucanase superfamily protein [Hephaestia caeni]